VRRLEPNLNFRDHTMLFLNGHMTRFSAVLTYIILYYVILLSKLLGSNKYIGTYKYITV